MIPKIIHYCWLSNDPYPDDLKRWMQTWKEKLPDYEFMLWNFDRFDKESSVWVKEAFENKKYAFAADYIRCYALYHYGGIYMDMDVEVHKSFNDLLDNKYILGLESPDGIEAAVMGCEKGFPLFAKMFDYYKGRHFVKEDGAFDQTTLPMIMMQVIKENYNIDYNFSNKTDWDGKTLHLYPWDYFTGKNYPWKEATSNRHTYSTHHCADSWNGKSKWIVFKKKVQKLLGTKITHYIILLKRLKELKRLVHTMKGYNIRTGMCCE